MSLLGKAETGDAPFFTRKEEKGISSLSFRLDRDNARGILALLPGVAPELAEILAPPALYGDEISVEEYTEALLPFLGKNGVLAMEKAKLDLKTQVLPAPSSPHRGNRFREDLERVHTLAQGHGSGFSPGFQPELEDGALSPGLARLHALDELPLPIPYAAEIHDILENQVAQALGRQFGTPS